MWTLCMAKLIASGVYLYKRHSDIQCNIIIGGAFIAIDASYIHNVERREAKWRKNWQKPMYSLPNTC